METKYKIIYNGRTERWKWQVDYCLKQFKHPAIQKWWLEAYHAYDKKHK